MMDSWLSVSQLSEMTEIPETTVRRYTHKFQDFFRYEKRGRGKKFHPDSIKVIQRIASLYEEDYGIVSTFSTGAITSPKSDKYSGMLVVKCQAIMPRLRPSG